MFCIKEAEKKFFCFCIASFIVLLLLADVTSCSKGDNDPGNNRGNINQWMKTYSIKESGTNISYDAGGTVDESSFLWPSLPAAERFVSSVMLRNTGDDAILNPRVSINGRRIPFNTDELLGFITNDTQDSLDRLLKIFYTVDRYSVHANMNLIKWQDSPLAFFVGYGGGQCEDRANIQRMLWDLLGYRSRNSQANNHTAYDVEYGDQMIHLDADTQSYYLMHDNRTGASSLDIFNDPMLVQRSVHYRNYFKYPIGANDREPDMWYSSEKVAALYENGYREPLFSREPAYEEFTIVLRPGEGYGWNSDKPKHLHPIFNSSLLSNVVRDFTWETSLDFSKASHLWAVQRAEGSGAPVRDGAVAIDNNTTILLSYAHPFPMTGARIKLNPGEKASPDTLMQLTILGGMYGERKKLDIPLYELTSGNDSLSAHIQKFNFPVHNLQIEIGISASGAAAGTAVPLNGLLLELYSQATAYAFRSLKIGRNDLVYTDASDRRAVEVQVNAVPLQMTLPGFSAGTLFSPSDNKLVAEGDLAFSWPKGDGADVKGYQIQISAFADMLYPLSPTFERMIDRNEVTESQGRIQYKLPWRGMLPVNRNLYWRVRPFREDLLAGQWSGIFPFKVGGPQAPEKINVEYDQEKVILSWSASLSGTQPLYYEIHSGSLEGFVPMSEPHRLLGFGDQTEAQYMWEDVTATDWPVVPGTLLTTTQDTRLILYDGTQGNADLSSRSGAHFRVIAVDADGSRSCPSPQAHLQSPLIAMPDSTELTAGDVTLQVPFISSVGRITTRDAYFLGLWNKPKLKYSLSSPSEKWDIDADLGVIKGYLSENEEAFLTITVEDQFARITSKQVRVKAK